MTKIGIIRSLMSNHQSNNFSKQLNKHLNFVAFLRRYFYEFCISQQNQGYFKGANSEIKESWGGKSKAFTLLEFLEF